MNTQKLLICTIVGTIFLFVIDYLWYGLLNTNYSEELADIMRPAPLFLYLVIGYLIFSYVFCQLFPSGGDAGGIMGGIKYGIMVGLMAYVSYVFIRYAVETPGTLSHWLVDSVYNVVKVAILGAIVGALNPSYEGRGDETASGGGEG